MRLGTTLAAATASGALVLALAAGASAALTITPTTTLMAETGNNTSTSDSFKGWTNGNEAPSNVSKVSIRTLLYPGSTTKVYAHMLGWWGTKSHPDIGYGSADPAQVKKQVADIVSRGCDGAIVDWYGPPGARRPTPSRST